MNIHNIRMADACIYRQYGDPVSINLQSWRPNLSFWPAGKYSLKTHHCRRQVPFGGAQLQRDPMIVFSCFCIPDVLVRYVYRRHGIHRYVLLWYIVAGVICKYDDRLFTYVSYIPKVPSGKGDPSAPGFGYLEATPPTATFYWLQVHRRPWGFSEKLSKVKGSHDMRKQQVYDMCLKIPVGFQAGICERLFGLLLWFLSATSAPVGLHHRLAVEARRLERS